MSNKHTNCVIETPALRLRAALVPWDTELLDMGVGQIQDIQLTGSEPLPTDSLAALWAWQKEHAIRMIACRLPHEALPESMLLEAHGFRFVEMVYPVSLPGIQQRTYPEDIELIPTTASDLPVLQDIARSAFATGRFNMDPRLGQAAGGRRYAGWVANSFADPRQQLLKACNDQGEIVAFFITEDRGEQEVYWHLTAVSPHHQGRGYGRKVWQAVMMRHRTAGKTQVHTTISARNVAVMNLYATLGARFAPPHMTFHWMTS